LVAAGTAEPDVYVDRSAHFDDVGLPSAEAAL
jgi:hypothetical protein